MNRNITSFLIAGGIVIVFIFAFPLLVPTVSPLSVADYFPTISLLLPIAVVLFLAPTALYTLNRCDIHFDFGCHKDAIKPTIVNLGITPFNFNRITFASRKKYLLWGRRAQYPIDGLFGDDVEYHGADTARRGLNEYAGCTVRQGMPVTVWIRGSQVAECLANFSNKNKIHLCLYYYGTKQAVYSQPIPRTLIDNLSCPQQDK